jgi:hypothetical protein
MGLAKDHCSSSIRISGIAAAPEIIGLSTGVGTEPNRSSICASSGYSGLQAA